MPDEISLGQLVAAATAAARAAQPLLTGATRVTAKSGHNDVVTEHDIAAEKVITEELRRRTPTARIAGEEGAAYDGGGPITWHVDPIDGTSNYATGAPLYCISLGATVTGHAVAGVILDPCRDELFATTETGIEVAGQARARVTGAPAVQERDAVLLTNFPYEGAWYDESHVDSYREILRSFRGVRRLGSSALALAWVAAGRVSAACELRTQPWDHAAGIALVRAAGGTVLGFDAQGRETSAIDATVSYAVGAPGFELRGSALERLLRAHLPSRH
ncbi:MAG: inositol monophosphatase family protein [Arachnia sp.]